MTSPRRTTPLAHPAAAALALAGAGLALLASCSPAEPPAPEPLTRACSFAAFYKPPSGQAPTRAAVIGSFNDWSTESHPMVDPDGDGIYQALIPAGPGRHTYMIYADGQTLLDGYNPLTLYADGREQSLADLSRCDAPALEVTEVAGEPNGDARLLVQFRRAPTGAPIDLEGVDVEIEAPDTAKNRASIAISPSAETIEVELTGLSPGKYPVTISAADAEGKRTEEIVVPLWSGEGDFDWRDAVIYQVVVDRFRSGEGPMDEGAGISDYHGGDLWGVVEAMEEGYFEALGVNAVWVSPLYDNPEGRFVGRDGHESEAYHGYWPQSSREVEARFGGEAALERLVEEAHARGIRVIMDAVLNHLHVEHPYFQQRAAEGWFNNPEGDCICGFSCSWATHMRTCWFDPFLADLNWERQEVVQTLVDDALWWLERYKLDGLRVDAVPMMPRLAMRHLRHRVSERLERAGDHVYLLGETYTGRGGQDQIRYYLGAHALSGQFDFPVMWALRDALAERAPMTALDAEVHKSAEAWEGSGAVMAPILGNHDVSRFISDVNGDTTHQPRTNPPLTPGVEASWDRLRAAWTFVMTQPGAPIIYYGDEIGLPGGNDPDNRRDMRFGEAVSPRGEAVLEHVQALGRARGCSAALRRGERTTLEVDAEVYAYGRDAGDGHPAIVVLNAADRQRTLELDLPEGWSVAEGATFSDLFGRPVTSAGRTVLVTAPPRSSMVLMTRCTE